MPPLKNRPWALLAIFVLFGCHSSFSNASAPDARPSATAASDAAAPKYRAYNDGGPLIAAPKIEASWDRISDQREGLRFEMPGDVSRWETGYASSQDGVIYTVELIDVPETMLSTGHALDQCIDRLVKDGWPRVAPQKSGTQSGVETRDVLVVGENGQNGIGFRARFFWRPERRRIIAARVAGRIDPALADRFLDSVTFF
jgi:hypothetical protein